MLLYPKVEQNNKETFLNNRRKYFIFIALLNFFLTIYFDFSVASIFTTVQKSLKKKITYF